MLFASSFLHVLALFRCVGICLLACVTLGSKVAAQKAEKQQNEEIVRNLKDLTQLFAHSLHPIPKSCLHLFLWKLHLYTFIESLKFSGYVGVDPPLL